MGYTGPARAPATGPAVPSRTNVRVFVSPLVAGELALGGDEHHYVARVRRARAGDELELVDGEGHRALARIVAIGNDATTLSVGIPERVVEPPPHVRVLLPLIKGDRMDVCLEKLVEVGASEIVIWPAGRAVVRLAPDRLEARLARFQDTARAAARQSGRATVPLVAAAPSLASALGALPAGARFVLDPTADPAPLGTPLDVTFVSGPEGGLDPDELDVLATAQFAPLGLGPRTLRAETAPVIAVALVRAATKT